MGELPATPSQAGILYTEHTVVTCVLHVDLLAVFPFSVTEPEGSA